MTMTNSKTEFRFRGRVNQALADQYRSSAASYGAERVKNDAATAKRAATTLKKSLGSFYSLKPEQRLALEAAASVLAGLASELDQVAIWAKAYKLHADAERARQRDEAEDAIAEKLWSGDDQQMLADASELVEFLSVAGQELVAEWLKQTKVNVFHQIYTARPYDIGRLQTLILDAKDQSADLIKLRRVAARCVAEVLKSESRTDPTYRDQISYTVGGGDYRAWKAWRKSAREAVTACSMKASEPKSEKTRQDE